MVKVRAGRFETATSRLKLAVRKKPYVAARLARGVFLLFRRNRSAGSWILKAADGHGGYWTRGFGSADDHEKADGRSILTFWEASTTGLKLARGKDDATGDAPVTLDQALVDYAQDLRTAGASLANVRRVRKHLSPALLSKSVLLLTGPELRRWRDGLIEKGLSNNTVNRTRVPLRAALELACSQDPLRLGHLRTVWKTALPGLPPDGQARNELLSDADVMKLIASAYAVDYHLGLLVETLAVTGARRSQLVKLVGASLRLDPPTLLIPASRKGGRKRPKSKPRAVPVPITQELAQRLAGAPADALLLTREDGRSWGQSEGSHRTQWKEAVARAGLDPTLGTYSLRHASIVRMLKRNVPVRVVAAHHDTGLGPLEKNYSEFIADVSDDIVRQAILAARPTMPPTLDPDSPAKQ
jgi:integrase